MEKKTCKRLRCRYLRRPARKIELLDVFSNAPRNLKRLSRQLFRPCCSMRPPFLPLRVSFSSTFAFLAHAPHPLCSFLFFFFNVCRRRIERRPCFRANHPMENRALRQIDLEIINFTTIGFVRLGDILDDNAVSQKADSIGSFDKFMPFGEFILLMTCFMNRAIKTINLARSSAV